LPERVDVGSMVEVPSLLYQLDELLERVDFLSIGSNDLVQFFYAADRGNARVADRFDPISVPVLRALRDIADKGRAYNKPVAVCGELASRPIGALALTAIGYRSLSLSPSAVGPVKAMLLDADIAKVASLVEPLLKSPSRGVSMRERLKEFAAAQGLQL
jgi:phosphotransferase system enzyme I (PtsP)